MPDPVTMIVGGLLIAGGATAGAIATNAANEAAEAAAEAEAEAAETQAEIARLEREAVRKQGEAEIGARTERFEEVQAAARNVYGFAGVELGEGSPLRTLQKSQARFETDIAHIREMMELGQAKFKTAEEGYLAQIPLIREAAETQAAANWWNFAGSTLGGLGGLFF